MSTGGAQTGSNCQQEATDVAQGYCYGPDYPRRAIYVRSGLVERGFSGERVIFVYRCNVNCQGPWAQSPCNRHADLISSPCLPTERAAAISELRLFARGYPGVPCRTAH